MENCLQRIRNLIDERPAFSPEGRTLAGRLIPPVGGRSLLILAPDLPLAGPFPHAPLVSTLIIRLTSK